MPTPYERSRSGTSPLTTPHHCCGAVSTSAGLPPPDAEPSTVLVRAIVLVTQFYSGVPPCCLGGDLNSSFSQLSPIPSTLCPLPSTSWLRCRLCALPSLARRTIRCTSARGSTTSTSPRRCPGRSQPTPPSSSTTTSTHPSTSSKRRVSLLLPTPPLSPSPPLTHPLTIASVAVPMVVNPHKRGGSTGASSGSSSGDLYLGLLFAVEEYKVFGYITNTKIKFVAVIQETAGDVNLRQVHPAPALAARPAVHSAAPHPLFLASVACCCVVRPVVPRPARSVRVDCVQSVLSVQLVAQLASDVRLQRAEARQELHGQSGGVSERVSERRGSGCAALPHATL